MSGGAASPLAGTVVGVTAERRWEEQATLLRTRGAHVVHGPTIQTRPVGPEDTLLRATLDVCDRRPAHVVATTGMGMRMWLRAADDWGLGDALRTALCGARISARGAKAASAVAGNGIPVWWRAPSETLEEVVDHLVADDVSSCRVAVQLPGARCPEVERLREAGAEVVEVPIYRWMMPDDPSPALEVVARACRGELDAVTFTSAPAVRNLFAVAEEARVADDLLAAFNGPVVAACVGPVCAAGAAEEGVADPLTPPRSRLVALVQCLAERLEPGRSRWQVGATALVINGEGVRVGDRAVELSGRELEVLRLLAGRDGAVVAKATLLREVWGAGGDEHVAEVTVARLRRRLGPAGAAIQTVPRRGYRLAAEHR